MPYLSFGDPFIGIKVSKNDYIKIKGLLPTPSYQDTTYSQTSHSVILIYAIDGYILSAKQYKWVSDIKISLKSFFFISYHDVTEFYITETTECNGIKYTLSELNKAFDVTYHSYPTIYYPLEKKDLYRHLIIHGKKLRYQKLFTFEAMASAALIMNKKLENSFTPKELHQKIKGVYHFILENQENFKEKLTKTQLKEAHSKGAIITNKKRSYATEKKIHQALSTGDYFKANGKINKTLLAKSLGMHRRSIDKYI